MKKENKYLKASKRAKTYYDYGWLPVIGKILHMRMIAASFEAMAEINKVMLDKEVK